MKMSGLFHSRQLQDSGRQIQQAEQMLRLLHAFLHTRAICDGRYKYSVSDPKSHGVYDSCSNRYTEEYLYDLREDPHESKNLIGDPGLEGVKARLRKQLISNIEHFECYTPEIISFGGKEGLR